MVGLVLLVEETQGKLLPPAHHRPQREAAMGQPAGPHRNYLCWYLDLERAAPKTLRECICC